MNLATAFRSVVGFAIAALCLVACSTAQPDCVCATASVQLACGEAHCLDGIGYRCPEAGQVVVDPTVCAEPPDLATTPPDLATAACVSKTCSVLGAECGPTVDNCGRTQDCGGCAAASLCASNHLCVVSCGDGALDSDETDLDCGGTHCAPCALGQLCLATSDCASGTCDHGTCRAGTFTALAAMPTARTQAAVAASSDKIFVLGGTSGGALDNVEVYTPASDSWSSLPAMPTARSNFGASFGTDGKLYAVGGQMGNNWADGASRSVERFDFGTSAWTALPTLPQAREGGRLVAGAAGAQVMIGGIKLKVTTSGSVTSYRHGDQASMDSLGASWAPLTTTLLSARHLFGTATLSNGSVLVAGGSARGNNPGYSPGCTGFCPPAELLTSLPSVELCTLSGSCSQLTAFPNQSLQYATWQVGVAHVDDTAVYLFGNIERTSTFGVGTSVTWKLDPGTKTWTRLTGLPTLTDVNDAVVVAGKIYVVTTKALYLFTP